MPKDQCNTPVPPLDASEVFSACDTSKFRFNTTKEIRPSNDIIAQKRAVDAINFGLGIDRPGYNIYLAGHRGTGKTSVIKTFLDRWAASKPTPSDWVYVHNFSDSQEPIALALPPGEGKKFAKLMTDAMSALKKEIPVAFQSKEYEFAVNTRMTEDADQQSNFLHSLEKKAKEKSFHVQSTPSGIETIPIVNDTILSENEYNSLTPARRKKIEKARSTLDPYILEFVRKVRSLDSSTKDFVQNLQNQVASELLNQRMSGIIKKYKGNDRIIKYLDDVRQDIIENIPTLLESEHQSQMPEHAHHGAETLDLFKNYQVNVFVDNSGLKGAPIVVEQNPTYYNLFGRIEKNIENGMFLTDYTRIRRGAIQKSNGGYLVLEVNDVFKNIHVWETLKRVIKTNQAFIEDLGEQLSMLPTSGLKPDSIPVSFKVILIGTDDVYHILHHSDDEFGKIFKIKADFDFQMERNAANIRAYVSFLSTRCQKEDLLPFDRSGVAAMVEQSSRMVEHQAKLSAQFGELKDLSIEADLVARTKGSKTISAQHVETAILKKHNRANLFEDQLQEMIRDQNLLVTLRGQKVGQVNALTVYDLGDYSFGKVSRVSCILSAGSGGIINVERESKLSGKIHDKGVHILTGFLRSLLINEREYSFTASICFEQSYGYVDGDSASAAELIAVISALCGCSVQQSVAVTGSINQFGEIQPVGGINEKVEGFYRSAKILKCRKDLKIVIPRKNASNLMLDTETRQAVKKGELEIYAVDHFWQAFEIATARSFGLKSFEKRKKLQPNSALALAIRSLEKMGKSKAN